MTTMAALLGGVPWQSDMVQVRNYGQPLGYAIDGFDRQPDPDSLLHDTGHLSASRQAAEQKGRARSTGICPIEPKPVLSNRSCASHIVVAWASIVPPAATYVSPKKKQAAPLSSPSSTSLVRAPTSRSSKPSPFAAGKLDQRDLASVSADMLRALWVSHDGRASRSHNVGPQRKC